MPVQEEMQILIDYILTITCGAVNEILRSDITQMRGRHKLSLG
jgi:hypothetical protein